MGRPRTYTESDLDSFCELIRRGHSIDSAGAELGHVGKTLSLAIRRDLGIKVADLRCLQNDQAEVGTTTGNPTISLRNYVRIPTSSAKKLGRPQVQHERVCKFCKQRFVTRKPTQSYCSRSCSARVPKAAPQANKPTLTRQCENCGETISTKRSEQRYCSNECRINCISRDKRRLGPVTCPQCQSNFQPRDSRQKFCSRQCAVMGKSRATIVHGVYKTRAGRQVNYESSYELVFLLYVDHHPEEYAQIHRFPGSISYEWSGKRYNYYPDFLCKMTDGNGQVVELKSTAIYERASGQTDAKLAAGRLWANINGMNFIYLTDADLRFQEMCEWASSEVGWEIARQIRVAEELKALSKHCVECGQAILRTGKGIRNYLARKFCSIECMRKWRAVHRRDSLCPAQLTMCENCGSPLYRNRHQKYCSKACYTSSQTILTERVCPICKVRFIPNSVSQKTCGKNCGIIHRVGTRISNGDFREPGDRRCICKSCGVAFESKSKSKSRSYCSMACYRSARKTHELRHCETCGKEFYNYTGELRFCSRICIRKPKRP